MNPFRVSLTAKLSIALIAVGGASLLFLMFWFTPESRDRFRERGEAVIGESSRAMRETAARDVDDSRDILVRLIRHTTDTRARSLEDLPLSIYDGDLERFREAIRAEDEERRSRLERNVEILAHEMTKRTRARIDARVDALAARQRDESERFASEVRRSSLVLLAVVLGGLLIVLGFALYRSVIVPIQRLRGATQQVAGGDLGTAVLADSKDEIGELASDFAVMVEQLRASRIAQEEKLSSLETLAGGVAHEFNNLIGGIRGTASEALADDADEELRRASLGVIQRAADRGAQITAQLRRYSRATQPVRRATDIARVLDDALQLLRSDAEARQIAFEVQKPARVLVDVDGDGLHQVFLNLLRNALQSMPDGGTVRVELQLDGTDLVLRVIDEGHGIPAELIGRVFDPFFTTKLDAVDAFRRGSGLGLSVSHGVVLAHGGTLTVESEVGRGSTFCMRIPHAAESAAGSAVDADKSEER